MDNNTLKAYIVEQRQNNITFQEISDKLREDFNIHRSRQAIQGLYNRTINKSNDNIILNSDILNIYSLGYNYTNVKIELEKLGKEATVDYVTNVIKNNKKTLNKIMDSIVNKMILNENLLLNFNDIKGIIQYKGIEPTEKGINNILKNTYTAILDRESALILSRLYQLSDNRQLVIELIKGYKMGTVIKDVENNLI